MGRDDITDTDMAWNRMRDRIGRFAPPIAAVLVALVLVGGAIMIGPSPLLIVPIAAAVGLVGVWIWRSRR